MDGLGRGREHHRMVWQRSWMAWEWAPEEMACGKGPGWLVAMGLDGLRQGACMVRGKGPGWLVTMGP